jgi:hypothetical protein
VGILCGQLWFEHANNNGITQCFFAHCVNFPTLWLSNGYIIQYCTSLLPDSFRKCIFGVKSSKFGLGTWTREPDSAPGLGSWTWDQNSGLGSRTRGDLDSGPELRSRTWKLDLGDRPGTWTREPNSGAGLGTWTQDLHGVRTWTRELDSGSRLGTWTRDLDLEPGLGTWTRKPDS